MEHNNLTIKPFMAIMAERDSAIRERNMALEERKRAFTERDMAMLQRDAALAEYDSAMQERDEAMATLHFRGSLVNDNNLAPNLHGNGVVNGAKSARYDQQMHMPEAENSTREILTDDGFQTTEGPSVVAKLKKVKQTKENKDFSGKRVKSERVTNREDESLCKEISPNTSNVCKIEHDLGVYENLVGQLVAWKDNLGLNQVNFDDSAMPIPICSCTGLPQPCYKWGSDGWQSTCCTNTMSMYPLPQVSNKRYARVAGRKMTGSAFNKLLNRLHDEGYDLSSPLDLKEHWAKRGTNRYSTVE